MTGFTTSAEVEVVLDERSVRAARQNIESNIGQTPLGIPDGGTVSAQAARESSQGPNQRRDRREHRWARERTNYLETITEQVSLIADEVEDDDGGSGLMTALRGGAFGRILLGGGIGGAASTATNAATSTAATGGTIGTALGVGSTVLGGLLLGRMADQAGAESEAGLSGGENRFSDIDEEYGVEDDFGYFDLPELPTIPIEAPDPIGVNAPESIPVDSPNSIPVDSPDLIPVEDPEVKYTIRGTSGTGPADKETQIKEGFSIADEFYNQSESDFEQRMGSGTSVRDKRQQIKEQMDISTTIEQSNEVSAGDVVVKADLHVDERDRIKDDVLSETENMIDDAMEQLRKEIVNSRR